MKKRKLVIITDCSDIALNEMRASIFHYLKKENLISIEPAAIVHPFSLINTAFVLRLMAENYPNNTIFYIVVNPIKEEPERIIGCTQKKNLIFVGRNTGVFSWLTKDLGLKVLYKIPESDFVPFGGKYKYPKWIASVIEQGLEKIKLEKIPNTRLERLSIPNHTVIHIDNFGLVKIKENSDFFDKLKIKEGDVLKVYVNKKYKINITFRKRMMSEEDNKWILYPGSSLWGLPEMGKVRCTDGYKELGIKIGDEMTFKK